MSKYIVDVGDAYIRHGLERTLTIPVRINEHEDHWMDTRIPVTPYTEPDLEQVKRDYDAWYEKGLADAWEAARKIFLPVAQEGIPANALIQIFGNKPTEYILKEYSASEAIEKIRQYELKSCGK